MEEAFFRQMEGALLGEGWNIFRKDRGEYSLKNSRKTEGGVTGRGWFKRRRESRKGGSRMNAALSGGVGEHGCRYTPSPIFSPSHPQALCFGVLGVLFMAISLGFMFANWATGQSHVSGH